MYHLWIAPITDPQTGPHHRNASRRISVLLACLIWIALFSSPRPAEAQLPREPLLDDRTATLTPDPTVQFMLNQVQSVALHTYVAELSGEVSTIIGGNPFTIETRSTTAASSIQKATQYAYERFQAMGLAVSYHNWSLAGRSGRNIIAEQPGANTGCIYLLTAHIDSTSERPTVNAPGADDNASGTAGVLVSAGILSQYNFTCTLRYVLFTGEEQGLLGSSVYAAQVGANSDPIQGVLNLDMIAYNTPNSAPTAELDIRSGSAGNPDRVLGNMILNVIDAYNLNLDASIYAFDEDASDHSPFWDAGYPAILLIEDWGDHTPFYHRQTDTLSSLNMPYFTEYTRAAVGTAAHFAQIVTVPPETLPYHLYLAFMQN